MGLESIEEKYPGYYRRAFECPLCGATILSGLTHFEVAGTATQRSRATMRLATASCTFSLRMDLRPLTTYRAEQVMAECPTKADNGVRRVY